MSHNVPKVFERYFNLNRLGRLTGNHEVAGSNFPLSCSDSGHTHLPLSQSSVKGGDALCTGKSTAGLTVSNGCLLPGFD